MSFLDLKTGSLEEDGKAEDVANALINNNKVSLGGFCVRAVLVRAIKAFKKNKPDGEFSYVAFRPISHGNALDVVFKSKSDNEVYFHWHSVFPHRL